MTGLNFSGAANLNAVASIIQAGTNMPAGTTVVWNASYARFEITSGTAGATSTIGFMTAAASGTFLGTMLGATAAASGSYSYLGSAVETAVAAVTLMDQMIGQAFYGVVVPALLPGVNDGTSQTLAVAGYIEGANTKHVFGVTTQEGGVLVATTTSDVASQLQSLGYKRTMVQYSSNSPHAVVSALARILTVNYEGASTAITLKFKQEPGVIPETLNINQVRALELKNANVFVSYENGTSILEQGVMADGTFADIITGTDWLALTIQRDLYNLLYTSTSKIPQTDQGMQLLTTAVEARCAQGVANGLLAPGVWNANGFGILAQGDFMAKGYYVYSGPISLQPQADRTSRMATPIQVAAKLAGAIHSASVLINVNQ